MVRSALAPSSQPFPSPTLLDPHTSPLSPPFPTYALLGFYLSCTYFHRRGLAARGRWPGGPKHFIDSHHILNGGVSDADAARLYYKEFGVPLHGHGSSDEKLVARHRSTAKGSKRSNGSRRESGSQRGRRYSGAQRPVSNGGVAGYIAPPSRSGSQRASVVEHSGHVYPQSQQQQLVQRGGSQRVPQRTGSVNSGMAYGHQPGYGSAPVSPIVGAPLGRNGSHRSAGVRGW